MFSLLRQTIVVFLALTLLTGVVYPLAITGIAQVVFPHQANGSLIERDGKIVGSELIGQQFDDSKYFWSRPSATSPAYNAGASSGSNLGPTNPAQLQAVGDRVKAQRKANVNDTQPVPIDLVTASASGLDPHISPAAAEYQVERVAKARNIDVETIKRLVAEHTASRQLGILGEPRVSVLELNLALDALNK
ncbi:MAG TPA: potassium-transporting ATPase subunit KdpC [Lacipirellulaceae bacterium]|jgi:K+-transporting ATPase ATPase C chain|nr:potassium-transporting ATPase subunit KdpC [Lacipirellulaceae bacterium]